MEAKKVIRAPDPLPTSTHKSGLCIKQWNVIKAEINSGCVCQRFHWNQAKILCLRSLKKSASFSKASIMRNVSSAGS